MKALIAFTACAVHGFVDGLVVGACAFPPIRTYRNKWRSNKVPELAFASNTLRVATVDKSLLLTTKTKHTLDPK
jgi:hypothetical protein